MEQEKLDALRCELAYKVAEDIQAHERARENEERRMTMLLKEMPRTDDPLARCICGDWWETRGDLQRAEYLRLRDAPESNDRGDPNTDDYHRGTMTPEARQWQAKVLAVAGLRRGKPGVAVNMRPIILKVLAKAPAATAAIAATYLDVIARPYVAWQLELAKDDPDPLVVQLRNQIRDVVRIASIRPSAKIWDAIGGPDKNLPGPLSRLPEMAEAHANLSVFPAAWINATATAAGSVMSAVMLLACESRGGRLGDNGSVEYLPLIGKAARSVIYHSQRWGRAFEGFNVTADWHAMAAIRLLHSRNRCNFSEPTRILCDFALFDRYLPYDIDPETGAIRGEEEKPQEAVCQEDR